MSYTSVLFGVDYVSGVLIWDTLLPSQICLKNTLPFHNRCKISITLILFHKIFSLPFLWTLQMSIEVQDLLKGFVGSHCTELCTFCWCLHLTFKNAIVCIKLFNGATVCIHIINFCYVNNLCIINICIFDDVDVYNSTNKNMNIYISTIKSWVYTLINSVKFNALWNNKPFNKLGA